MKLQHLSITNFKNIRQADLDFSDNVNGLLGNNGMGKSNLLDAIYFMSFCKSFSGLTDSQTITRGEDFMMIQATYQRRSVIEKLSMGMNKGRRKSLKLDGKEYNRLSEHIGKFPVVICAPQDIDLIRLSGETRRRWMDMVISQGDSVYLDNLIRYNRALEQRNALLRDGKVDHNLYLAVEAQMDLTARYIHKARHHWIEELTPIFNHYYSQIASDGEDVALALSSDMSDADSLQQLIDAARSHDEIVKHTTTGPHRDDIDMLLTGMPMRRVGSQGQCKSFVIALRLAQYELLSISTGLKPILLLDDIFDKLDAQRVANIMRIVSKNEVGQIFVTDTNLAHFDEIIAAGSGDYRLWNVHNGQFTQVDLPSVQNGSTSGRKEVASEES